jgi:hypothetical protein
MERRHVIVTEDNKNRFCGESEQHEIILYSFGEDDIACYFL